MNPRYQDISASRRPQPDWVTRGWRRRAELEPGQSLMRPELEIERLNTELGALKAAVLAVKVERESDGHNDDWSPLGMLFALVPGAVKDGES